MDAVFVVNPRAGRGRGAVVAEELPGRLAALGRTGEVVLTEGPRDGVRIAREAAERCGLVVAVGGDGTAHEVVNGLAGTDATFGVIPIGSGNDLAHALGIPDDVDRAIETLASGREERIDLGRYDDGWFANSLGLGFEAQVTIESQKIHRLRGFAIYLWAVVQALAHLRCPDLVIRADDRVLEGRRLLVCIGNGPRVGGGFYLTPDARPDDGLFDICLVNEMGRMSVMTTLPKAISGTHGNDPRVEMLRAATIEIESSEGFPFHVDGEVIDIRRKRLRIEMHPKMLKVIAGEGGALSSGGGNAEENRS